MPPTTLANASVCADVISPRGSGRARVRAINASIRCSTRQLIAAAAPATSAMPSVAANTTSAGGRPGVARNMPMTATKTISDTTRGLVSARNCRKRCRLSVATVIEAAGNDARRARYFTLKRRLSRSAMHAAAGSGRVPPP